MQNSFISYLITDPKFYGLKESEFKDNLTKSFQNHRVNFAAFRDKVSSNVEKKELLAKTFVDECKKFNIKSFINSSLDLALKSGANGVHLNSKQFDLIKKAKDNNLIVIISTHTPYESKLAKDLGSDFITYSPIFASPNKGEPKGIDALKNIVDNYNSNVIALGGIVSQSQIDEIKSTNAVGFASIRYFV